MKFYLALFLALLLLYPALPVVGFGGDDGGFGGDGGFGDEDIFFQDVGSEGFFIHDTLQKSIFLFFFIVAALLLHHYKREYRRLLLLFSFLGLGLYVGGFLCPFTAVQNVLRRYNSYFLFLFLAPILLSFFRGRLYCSYICPFGAAQELLHLKRFRLKVPLKAHRSLQKFKYALLIYLILRYLIVGEIILIGYSPFNALFSFGGAGLSIAITILFALLSLVLFRPFCQYLCPLGALLGLSSSFSKYTIIPASCTSCGRCNRECPAQILDQGVVDKRECLLCGECVKVCPRLKKKSLAS